MRPHAAAILGVLAISATSASARAGTWAGEPAGLAVGGLPSWPLAATPRRDAWTNWPAFAGGDPASLNAFAAFPAFATDGDEEPALLPDAPPELRLEELSLFAAAIDDSALGLASCELVMDGTPGLDAWQSNLWIGAPWPSIKANAHTDKAGEWIEYDQIARRWDRPESYAAYRYPLANTFVVSGYDLDKPDALQRRGTMNAVGHGGVDLPEKKGTPISMIALDHQMGDAEVLYVGHLFGETVVTRHTLREGGRKRDYVLLFGHLEEAAEGVRRGRRLRPGQLVGYVGNTDSPEFVHLHLEARRLRDGVDPWKIAPWNINAREISVVTDPRNVLPLLAPPRAKPKCAPKLFAPRASSWRLDAPKLALAPGAADSPAPAP